jgi:hypothetical protein
MITGRQSKARSGAASRVKRRFARLGRRLAGDTDEALESVTSFTLPPLLARAAGSAA